MFFQRDCSALRIFLCANIVFFCIRINALPVTNAGEYVQEFRKNAGRNYLVIGQRFSQVPRQSLPMRLQGISPKFYKDPPKKIQVMNRSYPEPWFTRRGLVNSSLSWNGNGRKYFGNGRRSGSNMEAIIKLSIPRGFYWESLLDGTIIAAIGGLFSKNIKNESNRERLEREKLRESSLLEKYSKILNDPMQLEILKRNSQVAKKHINQAMS